MNQMTITLPRTGTQVDLAVEEFGSGTPFLLLHGGAGPTSVLPFASYLAERRPARAIVPIHPGFNGTVRPDEVADARTLADLYVALIEKLDLHGVTVVGSSIGGWIAAEMALLASARISSIVVMNAAGIVVPGHPVTDVFALTPQELTQVSYHDPSRFQFDPSALTDAQKAILGANRQAIAVYGGKDMTDPTLAQRLSANTVPTLVLWGQSDRVVDPEYGRAYAAAIPGAIYQPVFEAGHLPHVERPEAALTAIWDFASKHGA
jgi:pimeloyl-ACP methyl ester carboxylesterase